MAFNPRPFSRCLQSAGKQGRDDVRRKSGEVSCGKQLTQPLLKSLVRDCTKYRYMGDSVKKESEHREVVVRAAIERLLDLKVRAFGGAVAAEFRRQYKGVTRFRLLAMLKGAARWGLRSGHEGDCTISAL